MCSDKHLSHNRALKWTHNPASAVAFEELGNDDHVVQHRVRLHAALFQSNNEVVKIFN